MKIHTSIIAVSIAALIASTIAGAAPPPVTALAAHPRCFSAGNKIYVRGAVADAADGMPVPGARVEIKYADTVRWATTGPGGIYHAEFPRGVAREVREISTAITAPTGTLIPVRAREGGGACIVPSISVGALREVGGSER